MLRHRAERHRWPHDDSVRAAPRDEGDRRAGVRAPDQEASHGDTTRQHRGRCVRANGIDIHYVEAGQGEPLLLLDNAMVSTNPIWAPVPVAYASSPPGTLAEHFRVIAPDTRGSGRASIPAARSPLRCWPTTSLPSSMLLTWTGR